MIRGFISAYHTAFSEEPGSERLGTHFHQRNPQKYFHIDYIYSKGFRVAGVQVEEFTNWKEFSDHVPLAAELTG
jgi:exodeoxyribonuclease-3